MSITTTWVNVQAYLALLVLVCFSPLLLVAALIGKICSRLYTHCVKPQNKLIGEVALVTGGGHGLGRAISLELAKMGCHMAIVDIDLQGAEETVNQITETYKVRAKAYKVNVTCYTELLELKSNITNDLGPVTVLVNNAGILLLKNSVDPEPNEVQRMIDVNLTSHFWTNAIFLPTMKKLHRGYIVSVSSLISLFPIPYNRTYIASKFGVSGYMKALRMELAFEKQDNIYASTVMPWFLKTNDEVSQIAQNIQISGFYPLMSGEEVARRIVQGMLCGEREIVLPAMASVLYRVLILLPTSWQERITLMCAEKQILEFYKLRT